MGTVVRFRIRADDAAAKSEAVLEKIARHYRRQLQAKEELPAALADLVRMGETDLALRAVVMWGSGEVEPEQVLAFCKEMLGTR